MTNGSYYADAVCTTDKPPQNNENVNENGTKSPINDSPISEPPRQETWKERKSDENEKKSGQKQLKEDKPFSGIRPLGIDDDVILDSQNGESSTRIVVNSTKANAKHPNGDTIESNKEPTEKSTVSKQKVIKKKKKEQKKRKAEKLQRKLDKEKAKLKQQRRRSSLIGLAVGILAVLIMCTIIAVIYFAVIRR